MGDLSIGKTPRPKRAAPSACARKATHHRRRDGVAASADHQRGGRCAIDGKLLAGGPLSIDAIGKIAAGGREAAGQGALRLDAGRDLTLAGLAETNAGMTLASGGPARGRQRHGLWRRAVVDGGPGLTLGATGNLQASGLLQAQAGGKLQRRHDLGRAGHSPVVQCRHRGERQDGRQWPLNIKAGTDLSVGKNGLAQGSGNLFLFAGQDLRIAGTAGTAETAATGGTLRAEAGATFS